MDNCYLIYTSKCSRQMTELEIINILYESSSGNARVGITSVLVHKEGQFMQLIEGNRLSILHLFDKIRKDTRHFSIEEFEVSTQAQRISTDFIAYRHKESPCQPKYRLFFKDNFDFKMLSAHPMTAYDFLKDLAKPQSDNKQHEKYKNYKTEFLTAIRKTLHQKDPRPS